MIELSFYLPRIYHVWEKWIKIFNPSIESRTIEALRKTMVINQDEALDLQGNVVSCFYIYGVCVVFVILAFVLEHYVCIIDLLPRNRWNCTNTLTKNFVSGKLLC